MSKPDISEIREAMALSHGLLQTCMRDEIALRFAVVLAQESARAQNGAVVGPSCMEGAYMLADYFLAEQAKQAAAR